MTRLARVRGAARSPEVRLAAIIALTVICTVLALLLAKRDSDDRADTNAEKASTATERAEDAELEAASSAQQARAAKQALRAQCRVGIRSACQQLEGLQNLPDPDDAEVQDPEIQNPEIQEPEKQNPEQQDGDPDDAETQDGEEQEPEVQDPEEQEPEVQDPEVDDPEPNDPQDPPDSFTLANFPLPGQTTTCTRDQGSPPKNPTYTCVTA